MMFSYNTFHENVLIAQYTHDRYVTCYSKEQGNPTVFSAGSYCFSSTIINFDESITYHLVTADRHQLTANVFVLASVLISRNF